jgi:hypothetical protein
VLASLWIDENLIAFDRHKARTEPEIALISEVTAFIGLVLRFIDLLFQMCEGIPSVS